MSTSFKCTEVAKTVVPYELKEAYAKLAHEAGCDVSTLLRDQMCVAVHGVTFGEFVLNHRRHILRLQDPHQAQLSTSK
jgi:hypothetical protein